MAPQELAAQQEPSGGGGSEASSVLTAAPHPHITACPLSGGSRVSEEPEPYCDLRVHVPLIYRPLPIHSPTSTPLEEKMASMELVPEDPQLTPARSLPS